MKIVFSGQFKYHPAILMKKCSYGEIVDRRTGQKSFVRRLSGQFYPRWHAYVEHERGEDSFKVSLHLDQKKASYASQTAHSGEYDGENVRQEAERIKQIINNLII